MKPYHAWTTTNPGTFMPSCLAISYVGSVFLSHWPDVSIQPSTGTPRWPSQGSVPIPMGPPEYNWMPFGFSKAPATFQRLMQTISCKDQLYIRLHFGVLGQLRFCSNSIADHLAWASLSEDEGPWVQYTRREVSVISKLSQVPWLCGVIWGRGNWPSKHRSSSAFPRCSDGLVGVSIVLSSVHSRLSVDSTATPSAGYQNSRRGKQQETRHWEGNLRVSLPQLSG